MGIKSDLKATLKNTLDGKKYDINNINMFVNEKGPKGRLSRSTTFAHRSVVSSFLVKKKRENLMTSFKEVNTSGCQKKVSAQSHLFVDD